MDAVGDKLGRDIVGIQNRPDDAWLSVVERAHSVEKMGRVCHSPFETLQRFFIGRIGVADGHHKSLLFEFIDPAQIVFYLRCERKDSTPTPESIDQLFPVLLGQSFYEGSGVGTPLRQAQKRPLHMDTLDFRWQ